MLIRKVGYLDFIISVKKTDGTWKYTDMIDFDKTKDMNPPKKVNLIEPEKLNFELITESFITPGISLKIKK